MTSRKTDKAWRGTLQDRRQRMALEWRDSRTGNLIDHYHGSAVGSVTVLHVDQSGVPLDMGEPSPVATERRLVRSIAVSWMSSSAPAGDWTATLLVRRNGSPVWQSLATATITTS